MNDALTSQAPRATSAATASATVEAGCLFEFAESGQARFPTFRLNQRILSLTVLFALELILLSIWLDTGTLRRTTGLTGAVGDWGPPIARSLVVMAAVFGGLFFLKPKTAMGRAFHACRQTGLGWQFLIGHLLAAVTFCSLSAHLFTTTSNGARIDLLALLWLICGASAAVLGLFAFLPPAVCYRLVRDSGPIWIYAFVAGVLVYPLSRAVDRLWVPAASLTFRLVRMCLQPFIHNLIVNPVTRMIGTRNFKVIISPQCSGMEGAGLMLLFGIFWLWFLRDELRFPRVLLLIPAGVAILYLLNALRIAALIAIGNAGAKAVAMGGFHSQAGWIAFNAVSLGLLLGVRHVPWLTKTPREERSSIWADNPAAPYVIPFLAILAAGMISRAATARFEWLYPLRFFAAASALWFYRRKLAVLDWRAGWLAVPIGGGAFAIWMILHRFAGVQSDNGIGAGLRAAAPAAGAAWLALRVLAAVVTVPIAEELAFRGFLIRWIAPYAQSLGIRGAMPVSIAISSLAFGAMHGANWIAGTVVGALYAAAFLRRGKVADAVVAHATTNALLAAWVLTLRDWSFW